MREDVTWGSVLLRGRVVRISRLTTLASLIATLGLMLPAIASCQNQQKAQNSPAKNSQASKNETQRLLLDATRVSTGEAAKSAAQEAKTKNIDGGTPKGSAEPAVLEFKPAAQPEKSTVHTGKLPSKDSKNRAVKNVHGTVYGSVDPKAPGNRQSGGAVGLDTKRGKTSIYIETDHSQTTASPTH